MYFFTLHVLVGIPGYFECNLFGLCFENTSRDCGEVPKGSVEVFICKVKFWKEGDREWDAPPQFGHFDDVQRAPRLPTKAPIEIKGFGATYTPLRVAAAGLGQNAGGGEEYVKECKELGCQGIGPKFRLGKRPKRDGLGWATTWAAANGFSQVLKPFC